MATQKLHLAYLPETPSFDALNIKCRKQKEFFDSTFTFHVIGSSHYIECRELGFYELLSCEPFRSPELKTLPLEIGYAFRITSETGDIAVETQVQAEPLTAFPGPDAFDIAYRFGEDAYTTIHCPDSETYITYHTYPEHDLALYTNTIFYNSAEEVPERAHLEADCISQAPDGTTTPTPAATGDGVPAPFTKRIPNSE